MATTLREPESPQSAASADTRSARALLAEHESPRRRILRLLVLLIAVGVLVEGWMVTGIDLGKLTNAPNASPILKALLTPDVAARDVSTVQLDLPITVGGDATAPAEISDSSGLRLRITPGAPRPGDAVAFDGSGFAPDADGQLRIQNAARGIDALWVRVRTDSQGNFHADTGWPEFTTLPADTYQFHLVLSAPTGNLHPSETLMNSLGRIVETILLALMGTVFGVVISVPLSFLGARNMMFGSPLRRGIYSFVRLVFTITRSIEVLILGVIMVVIVGIGSYAGVLAIVVHSIGSLGKLYSEAIEGIEPGPVEAITATGANRLSTVVFGVVPQVIPSFLSVTIYWWDHNVRMSTVLGLVGGGGIGYLLIQYMNLLQFNQAATVLWLIVIVVTAMDAASAAIRSRLV
jgi:phosphonate transport system permease protein